MFSFIRLINGQVRGLRTRAVAGACLLAVFQAAHAAITTTPTPTPGEWCSNGAAAKTYAEDNGIPLVAVWGSSNCGYCKTYDASLDTSVFDTWRTQKQYVFAHIIGTQDAFYRWMWYGNDANGIYKKLDAYPFVMFYWKKNGVVLVEERYVGRGTGSFAIGSPLADRTRQLAEQFFANYSTVPAYAGGQFGCATSVYARLEAQPTTAAVEVPLVRTNGVAVAATNYLAAVFPNGSAVTQMVAWAANDQKKYATVSNLTSRYVLNGTIRLILQDAQRKPVETNAIAYVAAVANGPQNPAFNGDPGVGNWTMDLAAATNGTAATSGDAYSLVLFTGALWCPYCLGLEHDVLSHPAFKTFTQNNKIRPVVLDNPRRDGTPPTLLRHDTGYIRYNANGYGFDAGPFSGSGYLSRNGIAVAQAEARLAANSNQQYHAGWRLPDAVRIDYPTMLLLRKDGTVAGRVGLSWEKKPDGSALFTTNAVTGSWEAPFNLTAAMLRFEEALELVNDPSEEKNGHRTTTPDTLSLTGAAGIATLCAADKVDVYRLTDLSTGVRQTITAGAAGTPLPTSAKGGPITLAAPPVADATVTLTIQDASGAVIAGPVEGSLQDGLSISYTVASTTLYLVVSATGPEFQGNSTESTIRPYALASAFSLLPLESQSSRTVTAAQTLAMEIVTGTVYRLTGPVSVQEDDFEALGNNLYRALRTGNANLSFTDSGTFTWQIWNPGTVGFTQTSISVDVGAATATFSVTRTGGSSGPVTVQITLGDGTDAGADNNGFPDDGLLLSWADGETGVKETSFAVVDDPEFEGNPVLELVVAVQDPDPRAGITDGAGILLVELNAQTPRFVGTYRQFEGFTRVAFDEAVGVISSPDARVTVRRIDGALPRGVRASYDATRGVLALKGTPSVAGNFTIRYRVSERVGTGATVIGAELTIDVTITDLSTVNAPATAGMIKYVNCGAIGESNRVLGLLSVTIGTTGRVTAKYMREAGRDLSFSGNWTACDADGNLEARIPGTRTAAGYELVVVMDAQGNAEARIYELMVPMATQANAETSIEILDEAPIVVALRASAWSSSNPASAYVGYYTVGLPSYPLDGADAQGQEELMPLGSSYMTLSLSSSSARTGSVRYAGKLANGTAFSGSAVLMPVDDDQATLTFFKKVRAEVFSGELLILADAAETYTVTPQVVFSGEAVGIADIFWAHTDSHEAFQYMWKYDAVGFYYDKAANLVDYYEQYNTEDPLGLWFLGADLADSPDYGAVTLLPSSMGYPLNVGLSTLALQERVTDGTALTWSFRKPTGIFKGRFRMNFAGKTGVNGNYEGVVLPGWYLDNCGGCGPDEEIMKPFGIGAAWFTDRATVGGVTKSYVRGIAVEVTPGLCGCDDE